MSRVVVAAEQVQVDNLELRKRLTVALHRNLHTLLGTGQSRYEHAIWSAIRKYASLIEQFEVSTLLPFLTGKSTLATRQVVLQAIHAIFQRSPVKTFDLVRDLAGRVAEIAEKYIDPDLVISPENNSLALNAFVALAALGDPRTSQLAKRVKEIASSFFLRRSGQILGELAILWSSIPNRTDDQTAAIRNVAESLSALR